MSKRLTTAALSIMLVSMAIANVLLIRQNIQMRRVIEKFQPGRLSVGNKVPSFSAPELNGGRVEIDYNGSGPKRILFFFTPTCPYCRQQFPYWREILERARNDQFEEIGLVDEDEDRGRVQEYLRAMGCSTDARAALRVAFIPKGVRQSYKLSETPITLLVNNDGTVEKAWAGKWSEADATAAGTTFGFNFTLR